MVMLPAAVAVGPHAHRLAHGLKAALGTYLDGASSTVDEAGPSAPAGPATIVVDPATTVRIIPPGFFGINYNAFWDSKQGSNASATALAQTPIRTIRFPGGVEADWYDWQQPYYKSWSTTSPLQLWEYARSLGATEVMFGTNYQGHLPNPPGQRYAVNSPENAAAWVAYDRTAGIAAQMEVGNEEDLNLMHRTDDPSYTAYIKAFNQQARAMHAADPNVRVLGPVATNEYYWWGLDALGMFLHGAGNRYGSGQADGVALHFYRGSTWYDSKGAAQYWLSANGPWAAIQRMIHSQDTRRLPVYLTEWNLGSSDFHNAFNPTLGHALATADLLGAFAQSGVAGEDYFTTHFSSGWGLLYGGGDKRPADSPTPTFYSMALWSHMGRRLVALSQSDDPANILSSYATTGQGRSVQVLIINKLRAPRRVRLTLDGATPRGHHLSVYSLQGLSGGIGDLDVEYDGARMPSPRQDLPGPRPTGTVQGDTVAYTVPGFSAVVLNLDATTPAPRLASLPAGAPAAAQPNLPRVVARGSFGGLQLAGGQTQLLRSVVTTNDDLGSVLVDFEVYDAANRKVFQTTRIISLAAGTPVTLTVPYRLPADATGGSYTFKLGVFGISWSPTFAWTDGGHFTVSGAPPVKVTAVGRVGPATIRRGGSAQFVVNVSATANSLRHALVDIEAYSKAGAKLCQRAINEVTIARDDTAQFTVQCPVPSTQPTGNYVLRIGVFGASWSPLYFWTGNAAEFAVSA